MGIGNHELITHTENCENCQKIQDVIDMLTTKYKEQTTNNQIAISELFELQNECYINSWIYN